MSLYKMPVQIYCESFLIAYSETGDERYLDYLVEDTLLEEEKESFKQAYDKHMPKWEYGVTNYDIDGEGTAGQARYAHIDGKYVKSHILQSPSGSELKHIFNGVDEEGLHRISKEWDRQPKGWISSKIRWLRSLYSNILGKLRAGTMQHDYNKAGFFGKVKMHLKALARTVLSLIDRMMAKLEHWTDKTENKDELKKSGKSDKLFKPQHELMWKSVMQTAKDNNLVKEK